MRKWNTGSPKENHKIAAIGTADGSITSGTWTHADKTLCVQEKGGRE